MTQKEKLIREYFALKNQYDVMSGNEHPIEAEPRGVDVWTWSRKYKVYELEEKVNMTKQCIERLTKEIERQKYFDTEEGKKVKETAEKNMEEARTQYEELLAEMNYNVSLRIVRVIGNRFMVKFNGAYDTCYVEVHYTDDENKPIFGHKFEVRYDKQFHSVDGEFRTDYELRMNYGTMGAFNLTDDFDKVNYLNGMANFATNRTLQTELVTMFNEYIERKKEIDKFYRENEKLIAA